MNTIWTPHSANLFAGSFFEYHKALACHYRRKMSRGAFTIYGFLLDFEKALYDYMTTKLGAEVGQVKAIAYFSWEHREQIFQVRRAYPSSANISTYSVCYPEWGVLEATLALLGNSKSTCEYPVGVAFTTEKTQLQRGMPFFTERRNLDFKAMIYFPVLREQGFCDYKCHKSLAHGDRRLAGVIVVFVGAKPCCDESQLDCKKALCEGVKDLVEQTCFQKDLHCFVKSMISVLKIQDIRVRNDDADLAKKWCESSAIFFKIPCDTNHLDEAAATIARKHRGKYYVVVSREKNQLFIASSDNKIDCKNKIKEIEEDIKGVNGVCVNNIQAYNC